MNPCTVAILQSAYAMNSSRMLGPKAVCRNVHRSPTMFVAGQDMGVSSHQSNRLGGARGVTASTEHRFRAERFAYLQDVILSSFESAK